MAQAVEHGQFELHYQPTVDLRSDQIVGAEALLRWRLPALGLLPPGQFLPMVESSGLMPEIGAWGLGAACRQMRDWRMLAWRPFRLTGDYGCSIHYGKGRRGAFSNQWGNAGWIWGRSEVFNQ